MRKNMIAGNWKMNKTLEESLAFLDELDQISDKHEDRVVICPNYLALQEMNVKADLPIEISAQNMHFEDSGAYTGEVSASMLKAIGISMTILGHSERRAYFNENDEVVEKKVRKALDEEIEVILCVGEKLEEREDGRAKDVVKEQLMKDLERVNADEMYLVNIAYEPVWAIGTGKTASSEDAQEMCCYIRSLLEEKYSMDVSQETTILYGGSVKPANVKELMAQSDIDGALVGGASLKPDSFMELVNYRDLA